MEGAYEEYIIRNYKKTSDQGFLLVGPLVMISIRANKSFVSQGDGFIAMQVRSKPVTGQSL